MTDFRTLCAELHEALEKRCETLEEDRLLDRSAAALRAALAQPEPQGLEPTDDELQKAADAMRDEDDTLSLVEYARAVLARWGRPTIEPMPVSERLPGSKDCDAQGRCWMFGKVEGDWRLISTINSGIPKLSYCFSHWLPHWALPVPKSEVGG
jgi:hypothetical protein